MIKEAEKLSQLFTLFTAKGIFCQRFASTHEKLFYCISLLKYVFNFVDAFLLLLMEHICVVECIVNIAVTFIA